MDLDLRRRLTTALVENGISTDGAQGDDGIHSWRCEYPDQFGECNCFSELLDDLEAAVNDVGRD